MTAAAGFWAVGAIILYSALKVVRSQDLVHAVLWLAVTLLGTAALYALLDHGFVAAVQVLTYVGGVVTLALFGVMVTRRHDAAPAVAAREADAPEADERGLLAAGALCAVLAIALWRTPLPAAHPPAATTAQLAHALVDQYLLAFEAISVLLLAAVVGAVVIARRADPVPSPAAAPISTAKEVEG